ncbi:MAG: trypsin-like peptidase domain-containing protein [Oscillospiraceae bacterium]|nr:trypsin-like peptidase domain-containing protein [Oscillospiraceae bacterium]
MNENENMDPIIPQEPDTSSDYYKAASDLPSGEPVPEEARPEETPVYTPPVYTPPAHTPPPYQPPRLSQPPKPPKKKKRTGLGVAVILIALCCGILGSICGGVIVGFSLRNLTQSQPVETAPSPTSQVDVPEIETVPLETAPVSPSSPSNDGRLTAAQVYAQNVSAVVGIANESTTYNVFGQASSTASSGSGFIISSDGEILTNYHVVQGAQSLTVTLYDGSEYPAQVLGYEAASDVALIKIDGENLPTVTLGSSSGLYVGAEVAAIGNPLGELTYSLNVGYISAMDRAVNTDGTPINMMQLDVSINSGNSGGPLFDMNGTVVGINTAKYSGTTGSGTTIEGIGFAIPIDDVKLILDDLRENGTVLNRAYMGVNVSSVSSADAQRYGIPLGAYVESVEKTGCAYRAGILAGDIVTAIDDNAIESYEDLSSALKKYRAGDTASVTVYRNGETLALEITFDAKPVTAEDPSTTEPETEDSTFNPWDYFFP